jgi:membrane protease YdiL (CAAX protease family)
VTDLDDPTAAIPPVSDAIAPPRRRPTWPAWVEILLCSGYPTQIVLGQMLVIAGIRPQLADGSLSGTFVFILSLADTVLLLSLIVWLLVRRGERPAAVFFGHAPIRREIAAGVFSVPMILAIVLILTVALRRLFPMLHNVPDNPLEGLVGTGANLWMFLTVVIVAGGVREELQRAFLLHRFGNDLGQPWMGVLITSIAFGGGHTLQGFDAAIITGVLGATWGVIYLARRSAIAPMISHSLFNSLELLRAFSG